ncbi:DUF3322 domain-containing protein [Sedimenticola hydrogenitrophicus]|uniref:DUF3322 domain-containing protein n=1 Tax=Sedimenticola hydrogenitrophicus TaxID=2967975 RepID=UPI0021A5743B|nr:Wadjet anti-phage system protein JetD domain-containing protein [Sedimenticola hydrogenitrophicus]
MIAKWTHPADVREQLRKLWDRGDLLRHLITGEPAFPLKLRFKGPTSAEIAERFDAVRDWITCLRELRAVRIQWREFAHRVHGSNALPKYLWLDNLDDVLNLIGKAREAARFQVLLETLRTRRPELEPWLIRRPLRALELADEVDRLLDIVAWLRTHPRPDVYLRQVDLPGVHTKFIEAHRGLLAEWLDLVLPPEAIDKASTGVAQFARRYGFRDKPTRIRFRPLDERITLLPVPTRPDLTLDADSFASLDLPVRRVFITENETNFLAFPSVTGSIVIFGSGYGWEALARAQWLLRCPIHYWGDIDTHGFAILDQLRAHLPHVESLLMDRETLTAHEALWGREETQHTHDLPRLTEQERDLFDDLRDNRIRPGLRLEQERIGFAFVEAALRGIGS